MSEQIPIGQFKVPSGWDVSTEIRMIEPSAPAIAAPLRAKKSGEKSRASLTASRYASEHKDAAAALTSFLKRLAAHAPNMKRIGEGALRFEDGNEGQYAVVTYELDPGRAVAQCHAFRMDQQTTSHLTASVEAFDSQRITNELLGVLATFRPI